MKSNLTARHSDRAFKKRKYTIRKVAGAIEGCDTLFLVLKHDPQDYKQY